MDLINLAIFLLLLASCLFAGVRASKKAPGKKIGAFIAVMAAFFITTMLLSSGTLDFLADILFGLLASGLGMLTDVASLGSVASIICSFLTRIFLFDIIFWIAYLLCKLVIKIIIAIIFGKRVKFFLPSEKKGGKIIAGVAGGLTRWYWSMFSILPIFALLSLFTPALQTMEKKEYSSTYVYEIGQTVNKDFSFLTEDALLVQIGKYTGANALLDYSIDSLATGTMINSQGKQTQCNVHKLLQDFINAGVDGAAIYEITLSGETTYGDLAGAVIIIENVTKNEVVLYVLSDYIGEMREGQQAGDSGDEQDPMQDLVNQMMDFYASEEGADNMANDFSKITSVLSSFIEANKDKTFDPDRIVDDLTEFVLDEQNMSEVITTLSEFSHFKQTAALFLDMGVVSVCEGLGIDLDEEQAYEKFTTSMLDQLNDKEDGTINNQELDQFIKMLAVENVSVGAYAEAYGEHHPGVVNHKKYMARYEGFRTVIKNQYFESMDQSVFFYSESEECLYVYDDVTDRWAKYTGSVTNNASVLIDYLVREVNALIVEENDYVASGNELPEGGFVITEDDFKDCLREVTQNGKLRQIYQGVSATMIDFNEKIARKMSSIENFETELVYSEDIIKAIDLDADIANQTEELGDIIEAVSQIFDIIGNTEDQTAIIKNFGKVGTLMDALVAFDLTSDMPEVLLKALAQNEDIAEYFQYDSIVKILQNIEQGKSTYFELCSSIQALYNIANGVM